MKQRLDLARDVLEQQVVDKAETKMGRVDGLVLELREDGPPRLDTIEMGFAVLARRIHPRAESWLEALRRRWSVRKTARFRVPWSKVTAITPYCLHLDLEALHTPAFDWERWLRDHVVARIPGARR
jgi:sporulation protein YlmC with PRC-barrel domain